MQGGCHKLPLVVDVSKKHEECDKAAIIMVRTCHDFQVAQHRVPSEH